MMLNLFENNPKDILHFVIVSMLCPQNDVISLLVCINSIKVGPQCVHVSSARLYLRYTEQAETIFSDCEENLVSECLLF